MSTYDPNEMSPGERRLVGLTSPRVVIGGLTVVLVACALASSCVQVQPAPKPSAPVPAAAAPAPAEAQAAAATRAQEEAQAQADAVGLLGAAGSMREAGDLGIALELGRQAAAKAPTSAEAKQFVAEVEAQKKAAEEAAKAEAAKQQAAAARDRAAADRQYFLQRLRANGADSGFVLSVAGGQFNEDELRITVGDSWYYQPKQLRLQLAQAYWQFWASVHSPSNLDRSRIKLVDLMGNDLGGSGFWGGSDVSVR